MKLETKATSSSSSPSSPKEQPQSLSSSGDESLNAADANDNIGLTNGKSSPSTITSNIWIKPVTPPMVEGAVAELTPPSSPPTTTQNSKTEPSYQNTESIRTSRASLNNANGDDANKIAPEKNALNGSESMNGNSTDAARKSIGMMITSVKWNFLLKSNSNNFSIRHFFFFFGVEWI